MKKETKHIIRTLGTILFILYVLALIYFLFFSEEYGRAAMEERQYRYNLIPFVEIRRFWVYRKQLGLMAVVTNLFGNVIGFLPFGFILPVILDKMRSGWLIVLAGFGLSVTVEVIQLITKVGCFDVDDMILNTAGAALGYLLFFICDHLRRKIYGKIVGGISLCAMLLSVYGFAMGLKSFSEENRTHKAGMIGSIANGIIMIGWLGIFLMGISG